MRLSSSKEKKSEAMREVPCLDSRFDPRYLVLDEADRLTEPGHFEELQSILKRLNSPESDRQTFLFSATLTLLHAPPDRVLKKIRKSVSGIRQARLGLE